MYELVKLLNKQGVELDGLFYNADTKTCVLHIPGFGGTLEGLPQNIGVYFQNNNIAYLCGLNQGSFPEHKFKQYYRIEAQRECGREKNTVTTSQREIEHYNEKNAQIKNDRSNIEDNFNKDWQRDDTEHNEKNAQLDEQTFTLKQGGGIYEDFDDCEYDIQAWIDFALSKNFDKIYLLGHSMGCNKILYFLNLHDCEKVRGLILLAPQDFSNIVDKSIHKGMIEEAENNIKQGLKSKLLTNKFLGFSPISSFTFSSFKNNQHIHNFSYKHLTSNFEVLKKISKPTFVIIGEKDQTFDDLQDKTMIQKYFDNVAKKVNNFSYKIIPNARHVFKNAETEVAKQIVEYITGLPV